MNDNENNLPKEEQVQAIKTTEFMKETIKQRPLNKKKLMRRFVLTVSMAVVFGLVACFTFIILEPLMINRISTSKPEEEELKTVKLVEETVEEEKRPQDMIADEASLVLLPQEQAPKLDDEQIEQVLKEIQFGIDDYIYLNGAILDRMKEISGSLVGVIGIKEGTDWFNDQYQSTNEISGVVIAENGRDYLILADLEALGDVDSLKVQFVDGSISDAQIVMKDKISGFGVISVIMSHMRVETREKVSIIEMGSSAYRSLDGNAIVVLGRPLGSVESIDIGYVTSSSEVINLADSYYKRITTDIYGSTQGTGIIVNLKGQLMGVVKQKYNSSEMKNMICGIGISELRRMVELMSNGNEVPYMGVYGTDITTTISSEMNIPQGALIRELELDSPFLEAGIQSGDVITKFAGISVYSFQDVVNLMLTMQIDNKVAVEVMRQGLDGYTPIQVEVVLAHQIKEE